MIGNLIRRSALFIYFVIMVVFAFFSWIYEPYLLGDVEPDEVVVMLIQNVLYPTAFVMYFIVSIHSLVEVLLGDKDTKRNLTAGKLFLLIGNVALFILLGFSWNFVDFANVNWSIPVYMIYVLLVVPVGVVAIAVAIRYASSIREWLGSRLGGGNKNDRNSPFG